MPYIAPDARISLLRRDSIAVGEVTYALTRIVNEWLARQPVTYAAINAAIGSLECAKLELYRRIAAPYEDGKRLANGDVYDTRLITESAGETYQPRHGTE